MGKYRKFMVRGFGVRAVREKEEAFFIFGGVLQFIKIEILARASKINRVRPKLRNYEKSQKKFLTLSHF